MPITNDMHRNPTSSTFNYGWQVLHIGEHDILLQKSALLPGDAYGEILVRQPEVHHTIITSTEKERTVGVERYWQLSGAERVPATLTAAYVVLQEANGFGGWRDQGMASNGQDDEGSYEIFDDTSCYMEDVDDDCSIQGSQSSATIQDNHHECSIASNHWRNDVASILLLDLIKAEMSAITSGRVFLPTLPRQMEEHTLTFQNQGESFPVYQSSEFADGTMVQHPVLGSILAKYWPEDSLLQMDGIEYGSTTDHLQHPPSCAASIDEHRSADSHQILTVPTTPLSSEIKSNFAGEFRKLTLYL